MAMYDFNLISQPYEGGKAPRIRSHGCIKDGWIRLYLDPLSLINDDMHVRVTSEHPSNEPHLFISKIQDWSDPVIECGPLPFTGAVRIEVRQWIDLGWGDWSDSTSWMITKKPKLPRVSSKPENQSLVVILIPQPSKKIYSYKLVSNGQQFDFCLVGHRTRTFVCLLPKNKFIRQHSLKFRIIPMLKHNRQGIPLSDDGSFRPHPTREGLWTADLRTDCSIIEYRRWMISDSSSQSSLSLANYYYEMQNELMIWLKIELNTRLSLGTCVNVFCHFCEITSRNGGLTTDSMMINKRRILKSMIESGADVRRLDVIWLAAMALLRSLKGTQPSDEDLECLMNVYRKTVDFSEDRSQTTRLISNGFGALIMSEVLKQLKQSMTIETRSRQHILVYLLFFNLISLSLSLIPRISDAMRNDFRTTKAEVLKILKKLRKTWLIGADGSRDEARFLECSEMDQKWPGDRPFPFEDLRTIAVEKQRKRKRSEMNNEGRQLQNEEKEERPPLLPSKRSNSVMSTSSSASSGAIGSRRHIGGFKSVFDAIIQDSHFPIVRSAHTILGIQPTAPHNDENHLDNGGNLGDIPQSRFPVSQSAAADQSLDNPADSTSAVESPVRSNSVATTLPLTPESSVGSGRGSQGLSTARVRNEEEDSDEEEESRSFIQIERGEFEELKREYDERTLKLFAVMRCLREKVRKELETEQPPIVDAALPALPPNQRASEDIRRYQWQMTIDERNMYRQDFRLADLDEKGRVDYLDACCRFDESNLEACELRSIWNLVNVDQKHSLNIHQYCALRFIVARVESAKRAGIAAESVLPQVLPPCLRPESIANLG